MTKEEETEIVESDIEEEEEDYAQLNANQNRKQKKAGGWQSMGLDHPFFKGIVKKGYRQPTPIQRKAIPLICSGKDVVAMSRTGSGKTAAFVVPMLQKLKKRDTRGIRALLFSPTRELALQTFKIVKELGRYTGLFCACLIGGDSMDEQFAVLHQHPDILLATPGRLLHVVVEMSLKLSAVQYLVFDEADRLFEMGFADQIKEILKRVPPMRQTLLFSATLPKMLVDFAKAGLRDPELVRLDVESKLSEKLSLVFAQCRQTEKLPVLLHLCRALCREAKKTLIFCATMKHVEFVVALLREAGLDPAFLYSQLDPVARKQNISRFRNEDCPLLVVTDIAARGVDIPLLDFAINFHFPPKPKLFVHRVGRVARAGKSGTSISFVAPDEMPYLVDLFLFIGRPMEFMNSAEPARKWIKNENSALIGTFPDTLSHLETEFLLNIQQNSIEISDLLHKSENAMKKYERTRPPASAESVRRVKREKAEFQATGPHPFFLQAELFPEIAPIRNEEGGGMDGGEQQQHQILQKIRNWRPNQAIFQLQNSLGRAGTSATDRTANGQPSQKLGRMEEQRARERAQNFVAYHPTDANTEAGLAVHQGNDSNFENAARNASLDLGADDEKGMYLEGKRRIWDRKKKKFVGQDGPSQKRVKTEEGGWVPASYKSGRYEKWKRGQKVEDIQGGEGGDGGEEDENGGRRRSFGVKNHRMKNKFKGGEGGNASKGQKKNELKNVDQIMKARRKKARLEAYQSHRRQENLKRKMRTGKSSSGAGGGGGRKKRS